MRSSFGKTPFQWHKWMRFVIIDDCIYTACRRSYCVCVCVVCEALLLTSHRRRTDVDMANECAAAAVRNLNHLKAISDSDIAFIRFARAMCAMQNARRTSMQCNNIGTHVRALRNVSQFMRQLRLHAHKHCRMRTESIMMGCLGARAA